MIHYFSMDEIRCKCGCEGVIVDPDFLDIMNLIREDFGKPIEVNRWYSCPEHDKEVGGKGNHPSGKAGDFRCVHSLTRHRLIELANKYGIPRIGVGKTFLHFDIVETAPTPRLWLYS
jgi:hypothetical protein